MNMHSFNINTSIHSDPVLLLLALTLLETVEEKGVKFIDYNRGLMDTLVLRVRGPRHARPIHNTDPTFLMAGGFFS